MPAPHSLLELRAPSPQRLVTASIATLALAGGLLGAIAVQPIVGGTPLAGAPVQLIGVCITTTALLALALFFGVSRSTNVRGRTVAACLFLGWVNCPAAAFLVEVLDGGHASVGILFLGLIFGIVTGAPLGLLYGLVAMIPMQRLRSFVDSPTLADGYESLRTVGLTLLGPALLGTAGALLPRGDGVHVALPLMLVVVAIVMIVSGSRMRARIHRAAGTHERVAVRELGIDSDQLLPLHRGVSPTARHALVARLTERGDGGYRSGRARIPIALVD